MGDEAAIRVAIETGQKRAFASAIDWPGWARSGRTEEDALAALAASAPRYAVVADRAGLPLPPSASLRYEVVERAQGGGGTDFGVPSRVTDADRRPTDEAEAQRLERLVEAAWTTFDEVAATAPPELRKGPRGGGRDTAKIVEHQVGADGIYAREIGIRRPAPAPDDWEAVEELRAAILDVLRAPSDGRPLADRRWTPRYAAHRIAWHALDHAWEIEDRTEIA